MENVSIWQVLTVLLFPIIVGAFWLLWARVAEVESRNDAKRNEIWQAMDEHRKEDHAYHVEAERRFVSVNAISELKTDFDRRFDRIEAKLDRAIGGRAPAAGE
jgi:hypothetical protein